MSSNSNTPVVSPLASAIAEALPSTAGTTVNPVKLATTWLARDTDVQLVNDTSRILSMMAENVAIYPSPFPTLAAITTQFTAFAAAVNGLDRSKASTVRRDQARTTLVQGLKDLALYVQHASGGDPDRILAAGFPLQRKRGPAPGAPQAPKELRLRQSPVSGRLLARCKAVPNAKSYQWRIATAAAPTAWTTFDIVTVARFTFDALAAGTQYVVQARAITRGGASNWSDSVAMYAN
jgi:hypothetical protein